MGKAGGYRLGAKVSRAHRERVKRDLDAKVDAAFRGPGFPCSCGPFHYWDCELNPAYVTEDYAGGDYAEDEFDVEPTSPPSGFIRGPAGDLNDPRWR